MLYLCNYGFVSQEAQNKYIFAIWQLVGKNKEKSES